MPPSFMPSDEQIAIVEAATSTKDNLLISALAGAAKSTTLELIALALPDVNTLCLAFNSKIVKEMKQRLPANCECATLNSIGHRAWGAALGKRLTVDKFKCADILKSRLDTYDAEERQLLWDAFPDILRAIGSAKTSGHVPDKFLSTKDCTPLISSEQFFLDYDIEFSPLEKQLINYVLEESMRLAFLGQIDFDDQVLMPGCFRAPFPIFSLLLVDEAQDLSLLNHAMLRKLYRRRIIAVGDQFQAIYAFRGAHEDGMAALAAEFSMRELKLTTTYRCPPAIVEHVRWRAPDIRAWDKHPSPGTVTRLYPWSTANIPDHAAVICRNNAPLFSVAISLLKSGRYPKLWGNDIGTALLKVMKSFGPAHTTQADALMGLQRWHTKQLDRVKNKSALADKRDCIEVFLRAAPLLSGAIDYASTIFTSSGAINLMTGHKAKGHEFHEVFFLNEKLVKGEGQDPNLRYVICTRAQRTLTYIDSADYMKEGAEE